jgi:6-phosphogluconate dehydrogenase
VEALAAEGAAESLSTTELVAKLDQPCTIWLMIPAAAVDAALDELAEHLGAGDTIIDGGNSHYQADITRAHRLSTRGIRYVDVGTSGGVFGLERGFCLMIGGEPDVVASLEPIFATLAPGPGEILRTPGRQDVPTSAERGYLHCGPHGAGHFVKMVHNGIEYGIMAAYAEGFNILRHANAGKTEIGEDAETAPLGNPEHYQYDLNLADIAELWRRGSVIPSWLLDLLATALVSDPGLESFQGRVADSGEGRWTLQAAIETGVPVPVLSNALFERLSSRGHDLFQNKVLSAMRFAFGGHQEKP